MPALETEQSCIMRWGVAVMETWSRGAMIQHHRVVTATQHILGVHIPIGYNIDNREREEDLPVSTSAFEHR
jgi:hypothetical protein